jgi:ribosomal protein L15
LKQHVNIINVGNLDELVDKLEATKALETKDDKPFLDLGKYNYHKLLASGKIAKPMIVKVASHSANAAKKVEAAGGKIISEAAEEEEFEEITEKSEEKAAKD